MDKEIVVKEEVVKKAIEAFGKLKPEVINSFRIFVPCFDHNDSANIFILVGILFAYGELMSLFSNLPEQPIMDQLISEKLMQYCGRLSPEMQEELCTDYDKVMSRLFYEEPAPEVNEFADLDFIEVNENTN